MRLKRITVVSVGRLSWNSKKSFCPRGFVLSAWINLLAFFMCSLFHRVGHHDTQHMQGYPAQPNGHSGVISPGAMGRMHSSVTNGNDQSKGSHRSNQKRKDGKTTRVRTVLNEKQLHTLRTCYAANCRPDALMKEQLTEMTGLSPRVIRVWFQNKRCKDKKRSIALKQMQEQQVKQQQQQTGEQVNSMVCSVTKFKTCEIV